MFEKEAEEWVKENMDCVKTVSYLNHDCNYFSDEERSIAKSAFKDGYNKANEWNTETPSSAVGNKDLLLQVKKDDFDVGYYHIEKKRFYTNDGREVTPLAWKVIVPPERKPEVEG